MMMVRLFLSQKPSGFVSFDDVGHRMRPAGILSDDSVDTIRRDLQAGCITGSICRYHWYRQGTPYCRMNVKKPCPCDDAVCGLDLIDGRVA